MVGADFTRTCEGCEHVVAEPWSKDTLSYPRLCGGLRSPLPPRGGLKMQDRKRETADALQNVGGDSSRKRRAITHTFIIIALSGTVCKDKKSSAKRVFTGSYGILTNRP